MKNVFLIVNVWQKIYVTNVSMVTLFFKENAFSVLKLQAVFMENVQSVARDNQELFFHALTV